MRCCVCVCVHCVDCEIGLCCCYPHAITSFPSAFPRPLIPLHFVAAECNAPRMRPARGRYSYLSACSSCVVSQMRTRPVTSEEGRQERERKKNKAQAERDKRTHTHAHAHSSMAHQIMQAHTNRQARTYTHAHAHTHQQKQCRSQRVQTWQQWSQQRVQRTCTPWKGPGMAWDRASVYVCEHVLKNSQTGTCF